MTNSQAELMEVIVDLETTGRIRSLFDAAAIALMEYSWSWRLLAQLESDGLVEVERNGAGVPLKIRSTEKGQKAMTERSEERQLLLLEGI
jgi:DNA-binding MarR family transcriptional regulator